MAAQTPEKQKTATEEESPAPTVYKRKFSLPQRRLEFEAGAQSSSDKRMEAVTEKRLKPKGSVDGGNAEVTAKRNLNEVHKEIPKQSEV